MGHENEPEPDGATNGSNDESDESNYESNEPQLNPKWVPHSKYKREKKN